MRTVISSSLTKIPIVGAAMGPHAGSFVVYFQAKGSGFGKADATDFSVDREKQQVPTLTLALALTPTLTPAPTLTPTPTPTPTLTPALTLTLTRYRPTA